MEKMEADIIQITDGSIRINTGMRARDFAQARLAQYLDHPGRIADSSDDGECTPWVFDSTAEQNDIIILHGSIPAPPDAFAGKQPKTLLAVLETARESDAAFDKAVAVLEKLNTAVENAVGKGIELPVTGPAGILVLADGRFLFLPEMLFNRATGSTPDQTYSRLAGCWLNPGLDRRDGLRFTLSVFAYFLAVGALPFPLPYTERRIQDYLDHNFVPLEYAVPGINPELAKAVTANLRCEPPVTKKGGRHYGTAASKQQ